MDEARDRGQQQIEIDAFAWASFITGAISIFFADRFFFGGSDISYLLISLIIPAGGLAASVLARNRIRASAALRGEQFAIAGGLLSSLGALVTILGYFFTDFPA